MPLFEYTCQRCGKAFERLLPRAEADRTTCPHCGSNHVKRELSIFAAAVSQAEGSPCASGTCSLSAGAGSCSTGACPFSAS